MAVRALSIELDWDWVQAVAMHNAVDIDTEGMCKSALSCVLLALSLPSFEVK
jgi:hypothetical protein